MGRYTDKNKNMKNILVILPIYRDSLALDELTKEPGIASKFHYLEDNNFEYGSPCPLFDVKAYVEKAIRYVKDNNIDGIIYSHDMASLVAGLVCEKTGLIGPSLESVFLACHKYYSRQIDPRAIPFQALDINNYDLDSLDIKYPAYIKAPCLMCSHLQFIVNSREDLESKILTMQNELPKLGQMFFDFFEEYISKDKYPLAHKQIIVIEELASNYKQCAIEGWVNSNGDVNIWAISDINYHEGATQAQNCYSMPTTTSIHEQAQMIALTTQTILNHGIRSGFFNVDIWHWEGKKPCKVIEVNGRSASLYQLMHKQCFNADLYKAMLLLCLGKDLECYDESPAAKALKGDNRIIGALFFVVTFGKGLASKFMNFQETKKMMRGNEIKGVELLVNPKSKIDDNGTAGFRMAKFHVFGSSYEEINNTANYWRTCIVNNLELSPYKNLINDMKK
jgi:hypothetical protein